MKDQDKLTLNYSDLRDLSTTLSTAVGSMLISLEEARAIFKRHLLMVGWKQIKPTTITTEVPKEIKSKDKKTKEVTK